MKKVISLLLCAALTFACAAALADGKVTAPVVETTGFLRTGLARMTHPPFLMPERFRFPDA